MNALKRYSRTLFCSVGFLAAALVAGCGGGGDQGRDPILGLPAADIVSVAVTPATASIAKGATQAFVATASYTDGSSRVVTVGAAWTSATPAVATVNAASGVATGVNTGTSVITAAFGGKSGTATLTVTPATLVSIALAPLTPSINIGASQKFTVTGTFSDNTTTDVTANSTFVSGTPAVATINATGLALGVSAGPSLITATSAGVTASTTLTVKPVTLVSIAIAPLNPSINIAATQQFVVTGTFSDNTTANVTANSTFVSGTPAVATISPTGLALGVTAGQSLITATSGGATASTTLTVKSATLLSLSVAPQAPVLQIGATRQLAVMAAYSDGSSIDVTAASTFVSATPASVKVGSTGIITGVAAGSSVITASFGGKNASTTATVNAATLTSIAVTPATATVGIAGVQQFVATATYSDNSTAIITNSVTWTSGNVAIATVLPTGAATGVSAGVTTITATSGLKSGFATLTVTATAPSPVPTPNILGRAANFAVLAGTALTNAGTTLVTGDVGSPSQTTAPTVAPGYTNYVSGSQLTNALADLQVAITDLNGRACTTSSPSDIDLGGQTIGAGVYCYAGNINITGTLILNGPGLYVFRTTGTLDAVANSRIILLNGADPESVFFVPVGPTTLGANGQFQGSILGKAAAITVGDTTSILNGRVLSAAAVTLKNNLITK